MAKMKNNKAILFTLSTLFLVMALFSLALLFFDYVNEASAERTSEIMSLDRITDISFSIEESLIKLLDISFRDTAIVVENPNNTTNVTITESLSKNQGEWSSETEQKAENFKTFIEEREEHTTLDIEAIQNKEIPMTIMPHNITYSRNWEIGHVIIGVTPTQMNFGSYDIIVDSGNVQISRAASQLRRAGNFSFSVLARDDYGFNELSSKSVDPSDSHEVKIFFEGGNILKVTLQNNNLEMWTNTNETIDITIKIDNLEAMDEHVRTYYPDSALNIFFPEFNISKIRPLVLK